jgi:hypothetical protein
VLAERRRESLPDRQLEWLEPPERKPPITEPRLEPVPAFDPEVNSPPSTPLGESAAHRGTAARVHALRLAPRSDEEVPATREPAAAAPPRGPMAGGEPAVQRALPIAAAAPPAPHRSVARPMLLSFMAGAVAATLAVVGVIAEMGETDPRVATQAVGSDGEAQPSLAPPVSPGVSAAPPAAESPSTKPAPSTGKRSKPSSSKRMNATKSAASPKRAKSSPPPLASRRFAWAPVDGAVAYRVELFRGNEQVLRATSKRPRYELSTRWRHEGRAERLTPGVYRWYVWPVLASGPAAKAVVQARLDIP